MDCNQIIFSGHAIRRMLDRKITKDQVIAVVKHGQIIMDYPDDKPYPSYLMLGFSEETPIHVVFAVDKACKMGIIVTTYIPDQNVWNDDYTARR